MPSYNNASRKSKVEDLLTEVYLGRKYYTDHQKQMVITSLKSPAKMMELMKKIFNDPALHRRYLEANGTHNNNTTRRSKPVPPIPMRARAAEYMPNMRPKAKEPSYMPNMRPKAKAYNSNTRSKAKEPSHNSNTRSKAKAPAYNSNTRSKAKAPAYNSNTRSKAQSPKSAYNSNAKSNRNSNYIPPMNTRQNHYKVLGVAHDASPKNIKKAYHKLALQHHPDKGGNTNMFKRVGSAYNVLKNADTRKAYNMARS